MTSHFRQRIAGAAVTCGLALGLWGALAENPFDDWGGEQGLAASVNGASVTADDLTLATEAVAADKRNALTDADRARILARLIDEELLIQRGIEVGLVDSDNTVRKAIVNAMISSILAEAADSEAPEEEPRRLYEESPALFSGSARYRVAQLFLANGDGQQQKLADAQAALDEGTPFGDVAARFGDRPALALPDTLLPPAKLRDYTGPSALAAVRSHKPGDTSAPVPVPGGIALIHLREVDAGTPRPFEEVRALVAAEHARRRDDAALRTYLNWLWGRADIAFAEGYTAAPEDVPEIAR